VCGTEFSARRRKPHAGGVCYLHRGTASGFDLGIRVQVFAARLQEVQSGNKPVLIRIETKAGHGAGKPTTKIIKENADKLAFLTRELGMK